MTSVQQVLRAVAAHGLAGSGLSMPGPVDDDAWPRLISSIRFERLEGLFGRALADGALSATPEQRESAIAEETQAAARSVVLERSLLDALAVLEEASIEVRVLKGSAVAHLDYPDPMLRCFGDVDLLVQSEQFDAAVAVLVGHGCRRQYEELRRGFDRRFGKGTSLLDQRAVEIDLHRTFVAGPFAFMMDLPALFKTRSMFELAGRDVPALGREERFLHACFHTAIGNVAPRLTSLRDVAQMALFPDLDPGRALDLAQRWRAEAVVARAVSLSWERLQLSELNEISMWASSFVPTDRDRRLIGSYLTKESQFARQAIAALGVIPGVSARAAYIWALVLPRPAHFRTRSERPLRRIARGVRVAAQRSRS